MNTIDIAILKPQIDGVCRDLPVRRLGLFDKHFELKERLEKVFGREVDRVVDGPFKDPVFKGSAERTRTVLYER
jgi:hypothetical protein